MKLSDSARIHFAECGLSYKDINEKKIDCLAAMLDAAMAEQKYNIIMAGGQFYWETTNRIKKKESKYNSDGSLRFAYITGKGRYFNDREVISFNEDGFIGFCGAADESNAEPIINAFIKWCDWFRKDTK